MFTADLHIHSKYARATSKECVPEYLELWASKKGLDLIGTGDMTHPVWRQELREKLEETDDGLYRLKKEYRLDSPVGERDIRFIVTGEISSIYKKNGKVRKIHNVVIFPSLDSADRLAKSLESIGANIHSDGRPIIGLDSRDLLEMVLTADEKAIFIPAHIWTPHFSLFGAYSGFDTIEECFEDMTGYIHALETGLSSDPPMNRRISALDKYMLVSNSDAHSPANLAREANIFDIEMHYENIYKALNDSESCGLYGTIEFFPEEGKYHYDGHRKCGVCMKPSETIKNNGICPVCGGRITVGVSHRVEELADRPESFMPEGTKHFERLVPLAEVIGSAVGVSASSVKVKREYERLLKEIGPELYIIRQAPIEIIAQKAGELVACGIKNIREGKADAKAGYDGEYGKISVLCADDRDRIAGQLKLFADTAGTVKKKDSINIKAPKKAETAASTKNIKQELNAMQAEAVKAEDRAVCVTAGPGTGKTKTLVSRIAYLIEKRGVKPSDITAVTFTNKAAGEMKERLEKHFGNKRTVREMNIGTFHSLCLKNSEGLSIADETDTLETAAEVLETADIKISPQKFVSLVSMVKNGADTEAVSAELVERYNSILNDKGLIDFDDILLKSLDSERNCPYLLVDEFQDINDLQYRLIKKWSENAESVFIIGDPDQSIYGFRGSDKKCFDSFDRDFYPVRHIRLKENYRSTPEVISCALRTIGNDESTLEAHKENGESVRLVSTASAFEEGIFIAKETARMAGGISMQDADGKGRRKERSAVRGFSDIAVLYRTNRQAEIIEECLKKEGIPYKVAGREDYLKDENVRQAVSFLKRDNSKKKPSVILLEYMTENGLEDNASVQKLYNTSVMYASKKELIQALTIGQEADVVRSGGREYVPQSVTLMTLHASKGLEFPVVFIAGVNEGTIPYRGFNGIGDLAEEKRLLYVGMTRAMDELVLLTGNEKSRFLEKIPHELLKEEKAVQHRKPKQLSLFE
ncbi:MAG: UvrD-helicase domain-containing protein [Clostridia bacterium]|nr:UvrD-helicase domain-containing protein [Clostridia bacterium]